MFGVLIGAVVTLVGVCMAEPNYRNIVKHETIKEIERKLPTEIPIHLKDMSGREWDVTVPVDLLINVRRKNNNDKK